VRKAAIIAVAVMVIVVLGWYIHERISVPSRPGDAGEVETTREVTLYFGSHDGGSLVAEHRQIISSRAVLENLRRVIEALLGGPRGDGVASLPASARLRGVFIHDRTAFLDFSQEIVSDFAGGTTAEYVLISSLVQTACANFPEVDAVRILVEGEEVNTIGGHLLMSRPLKAQEWR
jgi:spore germination protein GerM